MTATHSTGRTGDSNRLFVRCAIPLPTTPRMLLVAEQSENGLSLQHPY